MAIIYRLYSAKLDENVIEFSDMGDISCYGVNNGVLSADIPDTCIVLIKDSGGDKIVGWDLYGEIYIADQVHETVTFPLITSVSPLVGTTAGGTAITVNGEDFTAEATLTINDVACTNVTYVSATQLTADTPAGSEGAQTVRVSIPNHGGFSLADGFTYYGTPTLTACSPATGNTGTSLVLTGTNFQSPITGVTINGVACTNVVWRNSTRITCRAPANDNGTYDIVVTNPDTETATLVNGFQYVTSPTVTSVAPWFGLTGGGEGVVITGTGFAAVSSVTFGGSSATSVVTVSGTSVTCDTPARGAGVCNVVVTNGDTGAGTLYSGFEYQAQTVITLSDAAGADSKEFKTSSGRTIAEINSLGEFKIPGQINVGFTE